MENTLKSGSIVVGYVRVSTDGQTGEDKFGVEAQKQQIIEYCNKHQYRLFEIFCDEGKSGAKEDRPELDKIIFGLENPPVEAVIVAKTDRIARKAEIYYYYKHELMVKNIKLISIAEEYEQFGTMGKILEGFIVTMAELERENITKRTSGGRDIKARKGGYSGGKPPIGYYACGNGRLAVDEVEAELIRWCYARYNRGETIHQIWQALADAKIINRENKIITYPTVQKILTKNEYLYRGLYRYGKMKEWTIGLQEAILPEETDPVEVTRIKERERIKRGITHGDI